MKPTKPPFKVGDVVTSKYDVFAGERDSSRLRRRVTKIVKDASYGSGYRASADDGGSCKACHRPFGSAITDVDSTWFTKVK